MKKNILLFIVLSIFLVSIGGCYLPPPWPDRDERHDHDRDRGGHDRGRDHDRGRGGEYDHDWGHGERR
jgi:hypothetical protein